MQNKIILTDWPKLKLIKANLRGVETEQLIKIREDMFHLMMCFHEEIAGGYSISYDPKEIEEELKFRGVKWAA